MATASTVPMLQHIRRLVEDERTKELSDQELLAQFSRNANEAAFQAIVRRHGPMALDVCHAVVVNEADAEDAFQAVFLVLARKARSIRKTASLAAWLHGVAYRIALDARRKAKVRAKHEASVAAPASSRSDELTWREAQHIVHEELGNLAERHRAPLVMCYLQGRTQDETAGILGVAKSTLKLRLEKARELLRIRLVRRGLGPTAVGLVAAWPTASASAAVPVSLIDSTAKAAGIFAAGQTAPAAISPTVAALTEGVLKAMSMSKLKTVCAVVLLLGFLATGATLFTHGHHPEGRTYKSSGALWLLPLPADQRNAAELLAAPQPKSQVPAPEKETFTAWGKEVGGLQAGLGYHAGQKRAYHHGETVRLVLRIRNVSKNKVRFDYHTRFLGETSPAVTDAKGKAIPLAWPTMPGAPQGLGQTDLAPGKEIEFHELKLELKPSSEQANKMLRTLYGTGTFRIRYKQVDATPSGAGVFYHNPLLSKLATGKLELEVKAGPPPHVHQPTREEGYFPGPPGSPPVSKTKPAETDKGNLTAWGKEVGGLQAGLGYHARQKRSYHHGETVRLVVRIRNVSQNKVKFHYHTEFLNKTSPAVTDAKGNAIPLAGLTVYGGLHALGQVELAPGKEIEFHEFKLELKPDSEQAKKMFRTLYGTGTFHIQFKQVDRDRFGAEELYLDESILSKLATGKLELEVKSEPPTKNGAKPLDPGLFERATLKTHAENAVESAAGPIRND